MYGEVVDGVEGQLFEEELQALKERRGVRQDVELTADDLRELIATFQGIYEREVGSPFPQDAREQLQRAIRAVFDSWESPRARVYRRTYDIPDDLGTAVNVVQMVFGNKGDTSATGVCFTRDPSTGERAPVRRVPAQRAGRGRRGRDPHAGADRAHAGPAAGGLRAAGRDARPARGALPRHAGHRVHGRGRHAVPAPDPHGKADGAGGAAHRGGDAARGPDLPRGGRRPRSTRASSTSCCTR